MKHLLILILVSVFSFSVQANEKEGERTSKKSEVKTQVSQLSGIVLDEQGDTIPGAEILINGESTGVYTDFDGNFMIPDLKTGQYNIEASFPSYSSDKQTEITLSKTLESVVITLR